MRSLSRPLLRSRAPWHFLAIAGLLTLPTAVPGSAHPSESVTTIQFLIAQAESNAAADESDEPIDLQLGDTDPRVSDVQRLLAIGGYYDGEPSGIFDISTDLAVSKFQESHSLEPTGGVDNATWERLKQLENPPDTSEAGDSPSETSDPAEPAADRPTPDSGGFRKLMLWIGASIVLLGLVGMGFYQLLRLFGDDDSEEDFDDQATDELTDERANPLTEERNDTPYKPPTETALLATNSTPPGVLPEPEPEPASAPPTAIVAPTAPPPITQGTQAAQNTQTAPLPTANGVSKPEVAISMVSLAAAPTSAAPLSPIAPPSETALSSEIAAPKVSITERLLQELHQPDPNRRKKAIWELGRRGDSRAIQPLVNLMMRSDSEERSLILAVLAEINARSLAPMQQALMLSFQDESPEVRKNALRDLTRIFDSMSQMGYFIRNGIHDRDPSVRETAQWAMAQLERIRSSAGVNQLPDDREPPR